MADDGQRGRFGFPFTKDEYTRALLQVLPPDQVEPQMYAVYDDPETIGIMVADGDLLILASLSDAMAERVLAYRPSVRPLVERVRADPAAFLAAVRKSYGTENLNP